MAIEKVRELGEALRQRIGRIIIGQEEAIHLLTVALIAEGHLLFEGPPGTGKTLLARCFAACVKLDFKRVQFTPDLMPGDLIGANLFNFQTNTFTLTKGPAFTEFLLADEINRTPPKTQAALLEAMQERTITIDGTSYPLSGGFIVVATQNPIEQEGTYPLPEAQLDRFLFKVLIGYPGRDEELTMVKTHGHQTAMPRLDTLGLAPLCDLRLSSGCARWWRASAWPTRRWPTSSIWCAPRAAIRRCSTAPARAPPTCSPPPRGPPPSSKVGSS
jgi:MoxR-like ATPase